jgi:hypothetical protein
MIIKQMKKMYYTIDEIVDNLKAVDEMPHDENDKDYQKGHVEIKSFIEHYQDHYLRNIEYDVLDLLHESIIGEHKDLIEMCQNIIEDALNKNLNVHKTLTSITVKFYSINLPSDCKFTIDQLSTLCCHVACEQFDKKFEPNID